MRPEELQVASYRGAEWIVSSSQVTGGRRGPVKRFPNSDRQLVEDLGLDPRGFVLSGTVSARRDNQGNEIQSYKQARDTLLEALEKGGVGVLVHPFYGRFENIVVRTFALTEDVKRLGDSPITITFAVSDATGLPVPQESVLGSVVSANENVVAAIVADVGERFSVTAAFMGNFADALDKVGAVATAVGAAVLPGVVDEEELDAYSTELSEFSADVASLVVAPTDLADSISSLFLTTKGLFTTTTGTYEAFARLFDFGDDDVEFDVSTPGRTERQENRNATNAAVQGLALGHAYEQAARMDFRTTEEIEEISAELEVQYQKLVASGVLESDVEEALSLERIELIEFFDGLRIVKPRVITIKTNFTTTRLLAYKFYGSSELGDTIADLNDLIEPVGIKGEVEVLST